MTGILDMMGYIQDQGERGKQSGLNRLLGQAYGDPSKRDAVLGRMAQTDGKAAFDAQAHFEQMDDKSRQRLGQRLAVFSALPDEIKAQAYPSLSAEANQLGIPAPGEWNPEFAPHMQKIAQALTSGMSATPTGFRQFEMTAQAAGLQPGTPEYQQAANIALGREGRASSAGFGFELTEGMDGRKRLQRRNPRTGAVEVYDESSGDFVPVGGGSQPSMGAQSPMQSAPVNVPSGLVRTASGEMVRLDPDMPAADREAIMAGRMNDNGSFQGAPMIQQRTANPNLVVGRRPEDEALATETAKQSVQTGFLPQQEAIKTQAAIQQAGGVEQIKANIGAQTDVATRDRDRTRDADAALALLTEAEALVKKSTGSTGGAMVDQAAGFFGQSTDGAEAIAALQTIAGQLTSRMPRMQGPQSDRDVELYKQMAGDLANPTIPRERRLAALAQIRRLNQKYASQQQSAGGPRRLKYNPATGRIE